MCKCSTATKPTLAPQKGGQIVPIASASRDNARVSSDLCRKATPGRLLNGRGVPGAGNSKSWASCPFLFRQFQPFVAASY